MKWIIKKALKSYLTRENIIRALSSSITSLLQKADAEKIDQILAWKTKANNVIVLTAQVKDILSESVDKIADRKLTEDEVQELADDICKRLDLTFTDENLANLIERLIG